MLLVARLSNANPARRGETAAWTFGGLGAVFLALDDLTQVHESVARVLGRLGVPAPLGVGDTDLYVFAAYGAAATFAVRAVLPQLRRWSRAWLPGVLAIICFAGSTAVDFVPWSALTRPQQELWGPIEEILKTLGCVNLALFALLLAECAAAEAGQARGIRAAPDAQASSSRSA